MSLDRCIEYLSDDELLEVTPGEPAHAQAHFGQARARPAGQTRQRGSGLIGQVREKRLLQMSIFDQHTTAIWLDTT